jgi:hypothetical protein
MLSREVVLDVFEYLMQRRGLLSPSLRPLASRDRGGRDGPDASIAGPSPDDDHESGR